MNDEKNDTDNSHNSGFVVKIEKEPKADSVLNTPTKNDELKNLRKLYSDTVFSYQTAKTDIANLKEELEREKTKNNQSKPEQHDHCVNLNCRNLEILVKSLQEKLTEIEDYVQTAKQTKAKSEEKCENACAQIKHLQNEIEKVETRKLLLEKQIADKSSEMKIVEKVKSVVICICRYMYMINK